MDRVAEVLADAIEGATGRWLVACDDPNVAAALGDAEVVTWSRRTAPWPPDGPFDGIALRQPIGAESTRMTLHALAARLAPTGTLVVAGANDEGIRSVPERLAEVFDEIDPPIARRHCRVVAARRPRADVKGALDDWSVEVEAEVAGIALRWRSWPGLFAHGRLDPGTRLLLEGMPDPAGLRVLDFACGAGPVSAFALARGAASVDASDVDALAVHATRLAAPAARVHLADGLPPQGGPWDLVLSNPPLHRGKQMDLGPLGAFLEAVPRRLVPDGRVVLVTHATVPVRKLAGIEPVELARSDDAAYRVWSLTIPRSSSRPIQTRSAVPRRGSPSR